MKPTEATDDHRNRERAVESVFQLAFDLAEFFECTVEELFTPE
ncbi:hypothetical protein [Halovivax gelatinilyticus]|nr:hypothetical protein [Halovivax gelatinilyticus]